MTQPRSSRSVLAVLGSALAAWAAASGPAPAQEAAPAPISPPIVSAPEWREGAEWEYSDGYGLRVSSTNGVLTVFERLDAPGQWFSRFGFLRQDSVSGSSVRKTIYRTVSPYSGAELSAEPLTFRREYLKDGDLVVHATSWTVEGREQITVPAGTFDCWVIVWRTRSMDSEWTGFERWWYSPELQHYARLEYRYGDMETRSRVLMRYDLSAPGLEAPVGSAPGDPEERMISRAAAAGLEHIPAWTASLEPEPVEAFDLSPLDEEASALASAD